MIMRVSIIIFALSLSVFAKEDVQVEEALHRTEDPKILEDNAVIHDLSEKTDKILSEQMEAGTNPESESIEENPTNVQTTESDSIIAQIDTNSMEYISDSANIESENELTQEEADAEIANLTDSTLSDSANNPLILDMTAAVLPSASRRIASPYGIRTYRMHRGVDLGLCQGEDRTIVAAFTGVVKLVRNQGRRRGYGKYVILDHGNGFSTLYAHLASWKVNVGDTIKAGDTIGIGGNTGRSFGAHLHFEMRYNGMFIDPATVFDFTNATYFQASTIIVPEQLVALEDGFQKELSKHRYYKVRRGDCLGKIARRYGISVTRLKQLNNIRGNMIRQGQILRCS